jgi:WD40 repeat protein
MKTTKFISLFAILILVISNLQFVSYAGDIAKDTVWTKETNEPGFSSLQFIKDDQIIVAQAFGQTVFYDASNGNELKRILGSNKALFFNEEKNFLRVNNDRNKIQIFNADTYEVEYELINDDILVQEYAYFEITNDGRYLILPIINGIRVWDLQERKILNTKIFEGISLISSDINKIDFIPQNNRILLSISKTYKIDESQPPVTHGRIIEYDLFSLDSMKNWGNKGQTFRVSPSSKYIAFGIGGVQIYNLETGELISTIKLNSNALTGIEFSNEERYIVTSSTTSEDLLAIWDVKTGKQLYDYNAESSFSTLALSNDNNFIISAASQYILKWKVTELMTSMRNTSNGTDILYPNPTNGQIEVKYNINKPNNFQYEVTNIQGIILNRNNLGFKNIGENVETIDVNNLPIGQYNLRIFSENEVVNFKFIRGE